jgi:hypothetical protein
MAYPSGVATCPVSIKAPITFGGAAATVHLEVTPGVRLIWAATGQTLADFIEQPADVSTGTATVTLPTIQPGFVDEAGNAVLSWSYTARVRFEYNGNKRHAPLRSFTIPQGQTAVDLALIPAGPAAPVTTAPSATVTSLNGATGAVDTYLQLARDPQALFIGAITRDANGAPTSAAVAWPNGPDGTYTAGVYTGTPSATFPGSIDAYTITKGTKTYTQPAVTRDASGNITVQPAIVLS